MDRTLSAQSDRLQAQSLIDSVLTVEWPALVALGDEAFMTVHHQKYSTTVFINTYRPSPQLSIAP